MKKYFLILFLITSTVYAQRIGYLPVKDSTEGFRTTLPKGALIYDIASKNYWVTNQACITTSTLATINKSIIAGTKVNAWSKDGNTIGAEGNTIGSKDNRDVRMIVNNTEVLTLDTANKTVDIASISALRQGTTTLLQIPTTSTTSLNLFGGGNLTFTGARNILGGAGAGALITTASDMLCLGTNAGSKKTTNSGGDQCMYFGNYAGQYNTGPYNHFYGNYAGQGTAGSSTGGYNFLGGLYAGNKFTTATQNVGIGSTVMQNTTVSSSNTIIGNEALKTHTGAVGVTNGLNTAVGRLALGEGNANIYCNVALDIVPNNKDFVVSSFALYE